MKLYNTEQRSIITNYIKGKTHLSFSAKEIYEELSNHKISMSAIYRNLADFEKEGLIFKVYEKNRTEALYQYVNNDTCGGILHLKCETCCQTYHINKEISKVITDIATKEFNFKLNKSVLFLYGQCEKCSVI